MSRQKIVAGNWKMHGSRAFTNDLLSALAATPPPGGCTVVACPPFPYLAQASAVLEGTSIGLGAQDLAAEAGQGAFTGEVSGTMLTDVGVKYVLVGHSERRSLYGEADATVAAKFVAARAAGLLPILCVGESRSEREGEKTEEVLARQLDAVIDKVGGRRPRWRGARLRTRLGHRHRSRRHARAGAGGPCLPATASGRRRCYNRRPPVDPLRRQRQARQRARSFRPSGCRRWARSAVPPLKATDFFSAIIAAAG